MNGRWLDMERAAAHLSLTQDAFRRAVRAGRLPPASYHLGTRQPRWDVLALDARMTGTVASTDPSIAAAALVQEILQAPRRS